MLTPKYADDRGNKKRLDAFVHDYPRTLRHRLPVEYRAYAWTLIGGLVFIVGPLPIFILTLSNMQSAALLTILVLAWGVLAGVTFLPIVVVESGVVRYFRVRQFVQAGICPFCQSDFDKWQAEEDGCIVCRCGGAWRRNGDAIIVDPALDGKLAARFLKKAEEASESAAGTATHVETGDEETGLASANRDMA